MRPARALLLATAVLALVLWLALTPGRRTAAAGEGRISGHVRNGSSSGQNLAGLAVELHSFDGNSEHIVGSAEAKDDGAYQFVGLDIGASYRYLVSVDFDGVPYYSAPLTFASAAPQDADVTVYSAVESDAAISIDRLSIVIASADAKRGLLTLVESYQVANNGSTTVIGRPVNGRRQSLQFPLFGGAGALVPEGGFSFDDITPTDAGFALTAPLHPGPSRIAFSYDVPIRGRRASLRRSGAYRADLIEVVLPGSVSVSSPQLTGHDRVQLGQRSFDTILGRALPADAALELDISGLPAKPSDLLPLESLPARLLLVAMVSAAAGLLVLVYRKQSVSRPTASERERLVASIAELDDRYEAGEIARPAYDRARAASMARLRELSRSESTDPAGAG